MKALIFAAATAAALATAAPASAQVYLGAGPGGAGVEVGPFAAGVGPRYGWRDHYRGDRGWRGDYAYAPCRVVRERVRTPSGRLIIRTHRDC
jgi:hypothetical protein